MMKNFKPKFTITNRITAGLTRIERARWFLEAISLSEGWVREMDRLALCWRLITRPRSKAHVSPWAR